MASLLLNFSFSKAQTLSLSTHDLDQPAVYTFNYTTSGAIGNGTAVSNIFYFSLPAGYPIISPVVSGGNNLQPYITFKVNGVAYPCTTTFGIGGSWNYGVQLSVGGATTGVAIPAGAQIQVIISGLIRNPSAPGTYTISWRTARGSGDAVQEFNIPVNFSGTLGTQEIGAGYKDQSIYPNPATDYIQVAGLTKSQKYTIYNTLGSQIKGGSITGNEKIGIQSLISGVYFLKLENGKSFQFIKR